jgi:hypothetical protein
MPGNKSPTFDEISPFIHANDKTLYFASNGLPGFGGYLHTQKGILRMGRTKNIGNLINDHDDQFFFHYRQWEEGVLLTKKHCRRESRVVRFMK